MTATVSYGCWGSHQSLLSVGSVCFLTQCNAAVAQMGLLGSVPGPQLSRCKAEKACGTLLVGCDGRVCHCLSPHSRPDPSGCLPPTQFHPRFASKRPVMLLTCQLLLCDISVLLRCSTDWLQHRRCGCYRWHKRALWWWTLTLPR